jgi:hypothetical protein
VKRTLAAFQEAVKFADRIDADLSVANRSSNGHLKIPANGSAALNAAVQSRKPRLLIPLKTFHYPVQHASTC